MVASVSKHSQRDATPIDKAHGAILLQQNRRIMARVRVGKSLVRDIEYGVERSDKLIALDGFPQ